MKRILALCLASALLGGCAVVPVGYGYYGDGWRSHRHFGDDGYRRYRGDDWRYHGRYDRYAERRR